MRTQELVERLKTELSAGGPIAVARGAAYMVRSQVPGDHLTVDLANRSLIVEKNRRKLGIGGLIYARRDRFEGHLAPIFTRHARGVVLDIGANYGLWTTFCAALQHESGRVIAYEPHPTTFEILSRNVADRPSVTLRRVALGASATNGRLQTSESDPGSYHMAAVATDGTASPSVDVTVTTVDDEVAELALEEVSLMKIDVEGYEAEVLAGAVETLRRHRPAVLVELVPGHLERQGATVAGVLEQLSGLGYREVHIAGAIDDGNRLFEHGDDGPGGR